ncbi:MAG TPA: response regulator [Candidatus Binatia bacterium]|jgi:CheY-like chemotaxis protein|nr:response regulator [Candidatus Binatia bacterium]
MRDDALLLLVEDSEDDALLLRRVFLEANIVNPIQVVSTGEEALEYLSGCGRYASRAEFPLPALVLLDLNMPGLDGFEVLKWLRRRPTFNSLRVVVLTAWDAVRDINRAYKLGANSFLTKPNRFEQVSQAIIGYWLWLSKAPEFSRPAPVCAKRRTRERESALPK